MLSEHLCENCVFFEVCSDFDATCEDYYSLEDTYCDEEIIETGRALFRKEWFDLMDTCYDA